MNNSIRVRFAPSPTGSLHLGGARTALYNWLFAKQNQGVFIVRVEDTDEARNSEAAIFEQLADLRWLGLDWQEGPDPQTLEAKGDFGPYQQSQRQPIYQRYAQQLLEQGVAYYCFLTDDEIDQQKQAAVAASKTYHIASPYRDWPLAQAQEKLAAGEVATVRFKTPKDQVYEFDDVVRGKMSLPSHMVGDFVIMRSDGRPVYNFCCVIDDMLMEITHVLRGEDHLSNSLRQLMVYEAIDKKPPIFGHLSIILGENRKKLSKRDAVVSCGEFKRLGFLPQALNNYIALLGWSAASAEEIFTMPELVNAFDIQRLNPAAAAFDLQKLRWVNSQHLRQLPIAELKTAIMPFLMADNLAFDRDEQWWQSALTTFVTEMETLADAPALFKPLDNQFFVIDASCDELFSWPMSHGVISQWLTMLENAKQTYLGAEQIDAMLSQIKTDQAVKGKQLFMPIRAAVAGKPQGTELKQLIPLLSCEQLIERAAECLKAMSDA